MTTPYLVLARKYRPQRFSDLTGQEHVVRTLTNALKTGRVAHAFLFTGPRGCGKTTSARILARALNCASGPTPEPCGVCGPCIEIAAGNDVDVQEIDAASNNGVDDVRALREAARYLPARDRYKIYIVDEVHMLSGAAFNALLKTLEEPPGHIKFLLATTDPQKLPATILSRVQRHNFQLVPLGKIATRLREIAEAEKVAVADGALALVARQAQGSMRDALSLLDQLFSAHDAGAGEIAEAEAVETLGALDRSVVAETVAAVLRRDPAAALGGLVRAYEAGADFKRLAEELAAQARNLVLATLPGVKQDLPDHELRELSQRAREHDPAQLARVFELLQQAQDDVAQAASPRHALEVALLRAVYLAPSGSLPELVQKMDQLAGRLGGTSAGVRAAPQRSAPLRAVEAAPLAEIPPVEARRIEAPARVEKESRRVESPRPAEPPRTVDPDQHASGAPNRGPEAPGNVSPGSRSSEAPAAASPRGASRAAPAERRPPAENGGSSGDANASAHRTFDAAPDEGAPLEQRWRVLVESVRAARKPAAAAVLEHAVPLRISDGHVVVAFTTAASGVLDDKETRAAVEQAFGRTLGRPVKLVVQAAPAEAKATSLADERSRQTSERKSQRLQQGREHPAVRAAVEVLGGEIEDVRDLGEE